MPDQPETIEEAWDEYAGYAHRLGIESVETFSPTPGISSARRRTLGELMEAVHERLPEGMTPADYFDPAEQPTYEVQMWHRQKWSLIADRFASIDEAKAHIDGFADLNPDLPFRTIKVTKEVVS